MTAACVYRGCERMAVIELNPVLIGTTPAKLDGRLTLCMVDFLSILAALGLSPAEAGAVVGPVVQRLIDEAEGAS